MLNAIEEGEYSNSKGQEIKNRHGIMKIRYRKEDGEWEIFCLL